MNINDSFFEYYHNKVTLIEKALMQYMTQNINDSLLSTSDLLSHIKEPYNDAFFGGKYIRGVFVCLGYELFAGKCNENIIVPSIAYEIFQTSILLKDDIIDECDLRRGKTTLHKILEKSEKSAKKAEALTICLSDYGYGLVYNLIINSNFDSDSKIIALNNLINSINNTIIGQMLDIELADEYDYKEYDGEKRILEVAKYKTAFYTVSGHMCLGALLAKADNKDIGLLGQFGENLGIAFQIQDDIMGIYGENIGKPTDSDIKEKKITVLYDYTMKNCSKEDREKLELLYGNKEIRRDEIEWVKGIIKESGALDYAIKLRDEYKEKALNVLETIKINKVLKPIIIDVTHYLTSRKK